MFNDLLSTALHSVLFQIKMEILPIIMFFFFFIANEAQSMQELKH